MKKNFEIEKAILLGRGIKNYEKFLNPSVDKLNNPLLLADGKRAAKRILEAIKNREKICIFGHDDVDGITSTVILYRYLTKLGSEKISYYIPNREYEKYGIQKPFLDKILKENVKLIITVDSGINELDAIDFLNKQKIDSIILDHHIIYKEIPKAFAVVNPKRKDCKFPFNMLAGVGVVFNILKIIEKFQEENIENLYIILTGLGTISDRMPLIDDNRIFSKYIFENIKKSENTFLKFFVDENRNLSKQKKIKHLIKILTMGRDENGVHFGVDILLEEEILKVKEIYQILQNRLVNNNKEIDEKIDFIEEKFSKKTTKKIFIYFDNKSEFSFKYLGKIASYLADKYEIPILILTARDDEILSAESRGPDGFNWVDAFKKIDKHLIQFGGHKRAAGFTCHKNEYENICKKLENIAENEFHKEKIKKKVKVDYKISGENFNSKQIEKIFKLFSPFGEKNSPPKFLIDNIWRNKLEKRKYKNFPEIQANTKLEILLSYYDCIEKPFEILDYKVLE